MTQSSTIIIILGPTAVGKSDLAVAVAKKFNGEVISADSRQVYKGLNIGTGKITKKEMLGVRHHLLDVANPKKIFNAHDYGLLATKAIEDIHGRGKLVIICGGTGFYIDTVLNLLNGSHLPAVPPNQKLRKVLSTKTPDQLLTLLKKLDPKRAKSIQANYSESRNARRIIRAVEIAHAGVNVQSLASNKNQTKTSYKPIYFGLNVKPEVLRDRIHVRLLKRLGTGMIKEAQKLHAHGLSWKRMEELGLEYRYLAQFLKGKMTREEMIDKLDTEIWHYAKRQMTWFKRNKQINWFDMQKPPLVDTLGRLMLLRN